MQKYLLLAALLFTSWSIQAQRVTGYQLLPANATSTDNLKLVLTVYYASCTSNYGYTVSRTNSQLAIKGCYGWLSVATQCTTHDTIALGRLPAGSYAVNTTAYIVVPNATDCTGSAPSSIANASTTFTVSGAALAVRQPLAYWQLTPTVLPAAATILHLTNAPTLQQAIIYDLAGREHYRFAAAELLSQNGNLQLSLPTATPGLYFLRVLDASGQASTQRFVRQ